jgi:hypothetical protein
LKTRVATNRTYTIEPDAGLGSVWLAGDVEGKEIAALVRLAKIDDAHELRVLKRHGV